MTDDHETHRSPSPDAQWRADYRARQNAQRLAHVQPDLFGGPTIEVFRANKAPPPPKRTVRDFKPRPFLTKAEIAVMLDRAANWLRVSQRVKIKDDSPCQYAGRTGVIWRKASPVFADRGYVYLDLVGKERSEKIAYVEIRDVEPIYEEEDE